MPSFHWRARTLVVEFLLLAASVSAGAKLTVPEERQHVVVWV
jgi:hypothetical protein